MSEKWEVVSKKKSKTQTASLKENKIDKKIVEKTNYEDYLSKHQVKNIYKTSNKNNENQKPANGNVQNNKKTINKPSSISVKGKVVSLRRANTIEAALEQLDINDLMGEIESMKLTYVGSHLILLKGILAYLNTHLNPKTVPNFIEKPLNYLNNIVPVNLKTIIYNQLGEAGTANTQYFFDQTLTSLAVDMSNNQNCIGHCVMLHLIAFEWPTVCVNSLAKNAILRNSYQNRSNIGLNLLWALGQGGYKDLLVGLQVWQNIMLPVLEMKSYTKWVSEYVYRLLKVPGDYSISLTQNDFFTLFDELLKHRGISSDYQKLLTASANQFLLKYISSAPKLHNIFLTLFKRLSTIKAFPIEPALTECVARESECLKVWKMNYKKNIIESKLLLSYFARNWSSLSANIKQENYFRNFLCDIQEINNTSKDQRLNNETKELIESLLTVQEKAIQKKTKSSSSICPWLLGSFLLIGIISGLLAYDTHIHGGVFAKSATGQFLHKTGTLPYVEIAWTKTMSSSARGYKWAEKNVPIYYNQTCTAVEPYTTFLRDLGIVGWRFVLDRCEAIKLIVLEKTPIVVNFIDQYVPGLPLKIQEFSISVWNGLCSTSSYIYHTGCDFFKTKVFVGNLSPENLSKALNQTQIAAAEYYSWFHKKVDAYAKIQ